jgi:2-keto-3-deoxy-L-fuconate dehydrogenase
MQGKVVLITAAAQGIGRAAALAFAKAGARVVATDVNFEKLRELDMPNILTRALDVLVVHAGSVLEMSDDDLDFALDLNVKAQVRTIRQVLPQMLERRDGSIINMATVASSLKAVPNRAAYSISKAAVVGLTKSLAADYTASNIRVNAICPGTVESPSLHERWHATGDFEAAKQAFIARQPIGRIARAEEVADLAVYLAGATYTTGQVHIIDGGWTA